MAKPTKLKGSDKDQNHNPLTALPTAVSFQELICIKNVRCEMKTLNAYRSEAIKWSRWGSQPVFCELDCTILGG
jgi:hypothetical protein